MINTNKAARTRQLVFSVLLSFVLLSCEESGTVGAGFISESEVVIDTLDLSSFSFESIDAYTGRLAYSPIGKYSDQLYGNLSAVSYLRPSIANSRSVQFGDSVRLNLNLKIDERSIFGDTLTESSFSLYKITDRWRAASLKQNNPLTTEMVAGDPAMNRVAQFNLADIDTSGTVSVALSNEWEQEFLHYYNNDADDRDSTYFYENFGLAIIPDAATNNISYVQFGSSNLDIITPSADTITVTIKDWGFNVDQENNSVPNTHIMFNTFNDPYLFMDLEQVAETIDNQNFVRAEIVFYPDTTLTQQSLGPNEVRTNPAVLLFQILDNEDFAYEIGFSRNPTVSAFSDNSYRVNITSEINDYLFGTKEVSTAAIYMAQNSGYLGFSTVFGTTAAPKNQPKILIFNIEK